jgi:hypothetical protein
LYLSEYWSFNFGRLKVELFLGCQHASAQKFTNLIFFCDSLFAVFCHQRSQFVRRQAAGIAFDLRWQKLEIL